MLFSLYTVTCSTFTFPTTLPPPNPWPRLPSSIHAPQPRRNTLQAVITHRLPATVIAATPSPTQQNKSIKIGVPSLNNKANALEKTRESRRKNKNDRIQSHSILMSHRYMIYELHELDLHMWLVGIRNGNMYTFSRYRSSITHNEVKV